MGIATMATMVVILLQLNSSRKHEAKEEKKKKDEASQHPPSNGSAQEQQRLGMSGVQGVSYDPSSEMGQQEALGGEVLAAEGVSLG
jgi:hypothetical protein